MNKSKNPSLAHRQHEHSDCASCPIEEKSGCGCDNHTHEGGGKSFALIAVGAVLLALSFLPTLPDYFNAFILISAVFISGYEVFLRSIRALFKLKFDEGLMVVIAVIACFVLGEFREAAAVTIFFSLGQAFEGFAADKSRKSIAALASIRPDVANIYNDKGELVQIYAKAVELGTEIVILPHERVPINGKVVKGRSQVDTSALTGESLPLEILEGDEVLSGSVNGSSTLILETTAAFEDSAASRILKMVEDAAGRKGRSERIIRSFAKIYTPTVIIIGFSIAIIPSLITGDWVKWIRRGLIFLVASCPCALVLSVPLSFFASIGAAAKQGILVKGGIFIEAFDKAKIAVFDKTGTLTTGDFSVEKIQALNGFSQEEVLKYAGVAEHFSSHPIGRSIKAVAPDVKRADIENFEEFAGGGTRVTYQGRDILCGGKRLMEEHGIDYIHAENAPVYVAVNGTLTGSIQLSSLLRKNAADSIQKLKKLGFEKTVMLTGDKQKAAIEVADKLSLDEIHTELLPEDKLRIMEDLKKEGKGIIYVGDGINDAPVLAFADVGIAMGLGAEAASEAADMVLAQSNLGALVTAKKLFRRTIKTVRVNIVFSLLVKFAVLFISTFGLVPSMPIYIAVFADVGVMILTVLNAGRLLRISKKDSSQ